MERFKLIIIVAIAIFFCFNATAQQYTPMTAAGYQMKRIKADSTLHIPSFCGIPSLRNSTAKDGAIAMDTCNNKLYKWTNQAGWTEISAGSTIDTTSLSNRINLKLNISDTSAMLNPYMKKIDTTSLSNRINLKLNIVDTTNKWVTSVTQPNTTTIRVIKGSTTTDLTVGGGTSISDTAKVVIAKVHNAETTTLTRGTVVYLYGSNGDVASVKRANNKSDATSSKTFGFVRADIASGDTGYVTTQGQIEKLNLGAYTAGDILWLDSLDGQFTKNKPSAPYHLVFVGIVERANSGNGLAYTKPQNGYELSETHDVSINGIVNNNILVYSDTQSLWKNRSIYSVVDTTNKIATKSNVALKLNISDTSGMLTNYAKNSAVALKLNISDTSGMLINYAKNSAVALKLNISDTSGMLTNYPRGTGVTDRLPFWAGTRTLSYASNYTISSTLSSPNIQILTSNGTAKSVINPVSIYTQKPSTNDYASLNIDTTNNLPYLMAYNATNNKDGRLYPTYFSFKNLSNGSTVTINAPTSTSNRTINFQDASGTIMLQADTSTLSTRIDAKANLSQSSYTFLANNTNATANMTAQTFNDQGSQTYTGTITWNQSSPPSGTTNHSYRWTQTGKLVTLNIILIYGTASGVSQTTVIMSLPSGVPNPVVPSGMSATNGDMLFFGTGNFYTGINTVPTTSGYVAIRGNAGGNYEVVVTRAASVASVRFVNATVQYWTN